MTPSMESGVERSRGESERNIEVESNLTLLALKKFLATKPQLPPNILEEMAEAIEDAEKEIKGHGSLSQSTAEDLDDLFRPFK